MRNRTKAILFALATLVTAGIAGAITTAIFVPPTNHTAFPESRYVQLIRQKVPTFQAATTPQLRNLAHKECAVLNSSGGWTGAVNVIEAVGPTPQQTAYYLALTIDTYCPQLHNTIPGNQQT